MTLYLTYYLSILSNIFKLNRLIKAIAVVVILKL